MVTGATGFVGRNVVRELLARGLRPICVVRSPVNLLAQHPNVDEGKLGVVTVSVSEPSRLYEAAEQSQAAIHLVGIILERRLNGQTFARVHTEGTRDVVEVVTRAGIRRYVHMSALGTRPNAATPYHRTKWEAEECVRRSVLDWTILRPSVIHGPEGAFMRLMRRLVCGFVPPVIPRFGRGQARIQPVSVKDVAFCFVESLFRAGSIRREIPLGGPKAYSWTGLFEVCRARIPRAKRWKPIISMPPSVAKVLAVLSAPVLALSEVLVPSAGLFRYDCGQVRMAQEDSVCDHTVAERLFGIRMRAFEEELAAYAERIG